MENLDLNAYGVSEMSGEEMINYTGGGIWGTIIKYGRRLFEAINIAEIASELTDGFAEGFKEGYNGEEITPEYDAVSGAS